VGQARVAFPRPAIRFPQQLLLLLQIFITMEGRPISEQPAAEGQEPVVRRHVVVSGRVQGVFYRESLRRLAVEKGVGGWARNTRDGLEAELEGPRPVVDELVQWCRKGPPHAVVIHVAISDVEPAGDTDFRVR
jgi:acylphosphatase